MNETGQKIVGSLKTLKATLRFNVAVVGEFLQLFSSDDQSVADIFRSYNLRVG